MPPVPSSVWTENPALLAVVIGFINMVTLKTNVVLEVTFEVIPPETVKVSFEKVHVMGAKLVT